MILAFGNAWGFAAALGAATAYAVLALATTRLGEGTVRSLLLAAWLLHALILVEGLLGATEFVGQFGAPHWRSIFTATLFEIGG